MPKPETKAHQHALEIHAHLMNGSVLRYYKDGEDAIRSVVAEIHPGRFFAQKQFIIAGNYSMSGFSMSAVTRLDLVMDFTPDWPTPSELQELEMEEFLERYKPAEAHMRRDRDVEQGTVIDEFVELELVNGERIFLEFKVKLRSAIEQRHAVQSILGSASIHFRRAGTPGIALVNPVHIARWTLYPGPPEAPKNAWRAHRMPS